MLTSVTSFVMTAQAVDTSSDGAQTGEPSGDGTQVLRMATVENVAILESGDAQIGLLINIAPGQLADMYRSVLAAPADAGVGEEMPIPENKTVIGGVIPVRDEFVYSIKKEQKQTFGFELSSFDTTMVPNTEKNGIIVRVSASASTQVAGFTDVGSDVRWEILVGPKDDNATAEAAGSFFTKFAFARMMLESLEGVQVYEASRSTRIRLPVGATLLNGGDLDGRSWVVNFGGGTSATVSVFLDGPSTVLIDEKTVVAEQSITAAPTEVFEAFRGYGVFRIQYQLPGSSFVGGAGDSTSYSRNWRWDDSIYWRDRRALTLTFGGVTATLTVTPSFSFSWFIGWSFWDDNWPDLDWFKAWVGASASLDIELDITASAALDKTWEQNLFPPLTLATFPFTIGFVPVWVDLDLNVVASLHVNVDAGLRFYAKASIGASLKGGAQWVDGDGWSLIKESDAHATLTGPDVDIWTNGRVELGVGLRLELLFFSLAGPYIELQPYGAAALTYYAGDDILVWDLKTGLRLNAGLTMAGWIKDLLDIHDHWWNLYDWTIKEWSGHLGDAPSSISISLAPGAVYIGALTLVTGTITSPYPGSKGGTVDIEYSADGANWIQAGKTSSKDTGEYSFRWIVWDAGTFYVHARWAGNSGYRGATSASAVLPVSAVVTGLQWLAIDDGSWNIVTFPSWPDPHEGIANRFATPVPLWRVETISLFGTWYGLDGEMTVEVWDSNLNQLIQSKHRYSDVFPQGPNWCLCTDGTGPEWHDVDIPDVTVAGDFYVAVAGDPRTDLSYPSSDDNYLMLYWDTSPPPGPGYTVDIESDEIIGWDGRKALFRPEADPWSKTMECTGWSTRSTPTHPCPSSGRTSSISTTTMPFRP
ncbi:MAG: hypothetical protein A3K65_04505 [Euryarchaeota archaeon RBG_16_68_12]|nr:MAG: hypothetical protein A3K65_04505 [Euryarchaeota archaeon RBG_16_68_12]